MEKNSQRSTSIIIGSSSGIGRVLYELYREMKLPVVAVSRSTEWNTDGCVEALDLNEEDQVDEKLDSIFKRYHPVGEVYLVSGMGDLESDFEPDIALRTIRLNVNGFTRAAYAASRYFESVQTGHLIGITSVAAVRGSGVARSYNASKAYQSRLLEGIRCHFLKLKLPVQITEVRPGFVDTAMMKGGDKTFWVSSAGKAANQIFRTVKRKQKTVYVTKRWRLVAWILSILPERFLG